MDKDLVLMDTFMNGITQTGEWDHIQITDPEITDANTRWDDAMEQVKELIPEALYTALCEAYTAGLAATGNAGILFGIHVADVIRDIASRPMDLSRHIQNRIRHNEAVGA